MPEAIRHYARALMQAPSLFKENKRVITKNSCPFWVSPRSPWRISTLFQSSLKFMGIGPRAIPNAAEVLSASSLMHEVRLVQTPLITEDNPELDEDFGGGIATSGSLVGGERHHSVVLPVTDILHKKRVVSIPMVTEENQLADEDIAGSITTLANPTQRVKSFPDLQEPAQLTQASLGTTISPLDASDLIQPAIIPRKKISLFSQILPDLQEPAHHPKINPDREKRKPISLLNSQSI